MNNIKEFIKKNWFYMAAIIIPWLIAVIHSYFADTWVTGNGSLIIGDTREQLVPFAYELWEKVHAGESLLYTWNLAAGCDFHAVIGYFLSPFTILLLLFPKTWIPDMIQFTMIMKWALTSFTMVYFFYNTKHNTLKYHKGLVSLFLGLAFALSNSVINYLIYIQFGDITICFPLLLLLVEKMVEKKSWKTYYLLLTFCIISNSYMMFGICLFLIMWFVMQLNGKVQEKWKKFWLFAGTSVLSALTAVFLVIPSLAITQERLATTSGMDRISYAFSILMKPTVFIKQLFLFPMIDPPHEITPNIYFSVLGIVLALFFVFIKISKKRKLYMCAMTTLMIASFFVGVLSLVWHLFNVPNGVFHRFSNIFIFVMLFLVLYVFIHLQDIKIKHIAFVGALLIAGFIITFFSIDEYLTFIPYLGTILLLVLYVMLMFLFGRKSISYSKMLVVLSIFGMLELILNANYAFTLYDAKTYSINDKETFNVQELMREEVNLADGERITTGNLMSNITMLGNKASDSGFVSAINGRMQYFYDRLGMGVNGKVEYTSKGASPLINLIMNIRYGIGLDEMDFSDAEKVKTKGSYQLYKMNRLAGLGYMVDSDVANWNITSEPCFVIQNTFVEKTVGGEPIFTGVEPKAKCFDINNKEIKRNSELERNGAYVYNYTSEFGNMNDSIQMDIYIEEDMDLYMFSLSAFLAKINVFVDDVMIHKDMKPYIQGTYHIGKVKKGQKISFVAISNMGVEKNADMFWFLRFAKFNEEAYAKAYEKLSANVYEIETMESDYVKGSIEADKDGIMMTSIQAVDGFTVYVDGKETEYETIGGALIGVPLKAGKHAVEFKYRTPHLTFARTVSACAFAVFLLLCFIGWKRKNAPVKKLEEASEV